MSVTESNMTENILISFILSSLILIEYKEDIPIKDEAEFYKASIPHLDSNDYSYYSWEYGGGGLSRIIVNPN